MDFDDISHLTSNQAETKGYTVEEAESIYSLIQENREFQAKHGLTNQLIKQLQYTLKREVNQRLHATTLIQYHKAKRIPEDAHGITTYVVQTFQTLHDQMVCNIEQAFFRPHTFDYRRAFKYT